MSADIRPPAVAAAQRGAGAWRDAVHAQLAATPDHGDFFDIACELVQTLRSLESLAGVLGRHVAGYGQGRVLRDDAGEDPANRLAEASHHASNLAKHLAAAERTANQFWSAVGHIAIADIVIADIGAEEES
jgi:hypothetical protein